MKNQIDISITKSEVKVKVFRSSKQHLDCPYFAISLFLEVQIKNGLGNVAMGQTWKKLFFVYNPIFEVEKCPQIQIVHIKVPKIAMFSIISDIF